MEFVGVDLAWTPRGGTGVCRVTDGRVVDSARVSTDREIVAWLALERRRDVLVAIDAPLVVRNATGRRRCEQLISRCFGAHHAGAHSANLGLAAFRGGVRGERIARELGLDVDPLFPPRQPVRRAIEVYPHPAIVALFDLSLTLKYKGKPRRTLESRSLAMTELARHLTTLREADPPLDVSSAPRWELLCRVAGHPASGAELARVEDELDAFVCAYVAAYYWTHGTSRCRVVGDLESGYIVTPVSERQARCLDEGAAAAPAERDAPDRLGEAFVLDAFCRWLWSKGWTVRDQPLEADAIADRGGEVLYVEAKGHTAALGLDVDTLFGQLLRRMPADDDPGTRFAVVVPEAGVEPARRVESRIRDLLRIDVYSVGSDGLVRKVD